MSARGFKVVRKIRRSDPSESAIQQQLFKILAYAKRDGVEVVGIKNEGRRSYQTAAKMKAEGLTAGVPDILIMRSAEDGGMAWLEMKTRTGSLSVAQMGFAAKMKRMGIPWAMARSVEEALDVMRAWGVIL